MTWFASSSELIRSSRKLAGEKLPVMPLTCSFANHSWKLGYTLSRTIFHEVYATKQNLLILGGKVLTLVWHQHRSLHVLWREGEFPQFMFPVNWKLPYLVCFEEAYWINAFLPLLLASSLILILHVHVGGHPIPVSAFMGSDSLGHPKLKITWFGNHTHTSFHLSHWWLLANLWFHLSTDSFSDVHQSSA